MPNWVQTELILNGEEKDIEKVLELVKSEDSAFDFNELIPTPKTLKLPAGGYDKEAIQYAISKMSKAKQAEIKVALAQTPCSFYGSYFKKVYGRTFTDKELEECAKNFIGKGNSNVFDETDYAALNIKTFEDFGNMYIYNITTYGCDTWYDWCCKYWGTKWNACDVYINGNVICFQTAWSVPDPILEEFAFLCDEYNVTFEGKYADEDRGNNTGHISSDYGITSYENGSQDALRTYIELWGESGCIGEDENGNLIAYDCDNCPNGCY